MTKMNIQSTTVVDLVRPLRISTIWIAALMLLACSFNGESSSGKHGNAELLMAIKVEIAEAPCDGNAQCHTLPLGSKACGGPEAYLAWSNKNSSSTKLQPLADAYKSVRRANNEQSGMSSICVAVVDPGAICQIPERGNAHALAQPAGRCVLGSQHVTGH